MDCCEALDNIQKICGGGNAAGIKQKLYVACVDRIASIPAADDYPNTPGAAPHTISQDIVMTMDDIATPEDETGRFYCWAISKQDNGYVAEPQGESDSSGWKGTVNAYIPRLHPLTTHILNGTSGGEFVLIFEDKNGYRRVLGEIDDGVTIKVKEQTNDKNGYIVTIEWDTSYLPYFYTGIIVT